MNIRKRALPALLALLWVGCQTIGGFDPIEVDLSAKRPPAPTATPTPATPARMPIESPVPRAAVVTPISTTVSEARPALSPPPAARTGVGSPEALAKRRVDGYNLRDLDLLMALYSPDARIYDPPDRLRDSGANQIRQSYTRGFAERPDSRLEIRVVQAQGAYAVSRETESTGAGAGSTALVISEVRDGRIVRVWILR